MILIYLVPFLFSNDPSRLVTFPDDLQLLEFDEYASYIVAKQILGESIWTLSWRSECYFRQIYKCQLSYEYSR